ncbi:MAG: DNA replication/repair protein RecF [Phaeodactylibacter sp.]|uniref:DNA replication/repair protein RecF n=1 Tax=Phaeodactylibacter sp. TaxID=1940289 RepID=UPI0032ED6C74
MRLTSFKLTQFKNYAFQSIACDAPLVCFIGANGMGKTNLLDAIYYLCMGKSYFNAPDSLIANHDSDFFRLEGQFMAYGAPEHIVAKVIPRKKKELERNRIPYPRLSEHVGLLPVVMIAPDDTYLVSEGSEARRSFLDNTLSQINPDYLSQLILYNKLLQQRNALLKKFGESRTYNAAIVEVYNQQMLAPARLLHESRANFMKQFQPILQQAYTQISGGAESVDCTYRSKMSETPLEALFEASAEKDRLLQRTTAGPHRDDLIFTIEGYPLKRFASQGQLKSFVLAVKLGQYQMLGLEKKTSPILLLDDIFDKLDRQRVQHLIRLLQEQTFGQVFITDTEQDRLAGIIQQTGQNFLVYEIQEGAASQTYP